MIDGSALYTQIILDRGRAPRFQRSVPQPDAAAQLENRLCGDRIGIALRFGANGAVLEAGHETAGCLILEASADLMAEHAIGQSTPQLRAMAVQFEGMVRSGEAADCPPDLRGFAELHTTPARASCATLPWQALLQALDQRDHVL